MLMELGGLDFVVAYSGEITVTTNKGIPSIPLIVGKASRDATFVPSNNRSSLTFRYTVQSDDNGTLLVGSEFDLNGSLIQDSGGYTTACFRLHHPTARKFSSTLRLP